MTNKLTQTLKRIRVDMAGEIDAASQQGDTVMMMAVVRVRDALNEMLVALGDEEAVRCEDGHAGLDELNAMGRYSGVGCPDCGPDTDVEGDHVEIDGPAARQEVTCSECGRAWINRYRFNGRGPAG